MTKTHQTISPEHLAKALDSSSADADHLIVDVRTPAECEEQALRCGYANHPLDRIDAAGIRSEAGDREIVVVCRTGRRAQEAAEKLGDAGCEKVSVLEGGLTAWREAGHPVHEGERKVISLERQVRIAAGALVLLGVLLGANVHGGWYGLSAFVGAGLMFAGITDTCGMAMLMARMPWNQASKDCRSCTTG